MTGVIVLLVIINSLYFTFQNWIIESNWRVLKMEYRNNYVTGKQSIIFSIAVYIKKHFSYRVGTALLNAFC